MDLKIREVAGLLNVSEKTIRRWLADGKIPAYRLNSQYRFSRIEIENWVMGCKLHRGEPGILSLTSEGRGSNTVEEHSISDAQGGMRQFSLYRAVHRGGILNQMPGASKEEVIKGTMEASATLLGRDADILSELLMDRERLMPTSLNHGIAVPHSREFVFEGAFDVVIVVFPQHPLDYGALDGQPVHTLFFLFASNDKSHLHLLAKIAHLSGRPKALQFFHTRPGKQEVLEFIREWESEIGHSESRRIELGS